MDAKLDAITRFVRSCDPRAPLQPGDSRYISCDELRGGQFVERYVRCFQRADPTVPLVRGFAGHIGVGKSTELLRLKKGLETVGFRVVYFDVSEDDLGMDCNDLDFPELLVYIAGQVGKQLRELGDQLGFKAESSLFTSMWEQLKGLVRADVMVDGRKIEVPYLPLAIEVRNQATARQKLRQEIEAHSTNLLAAVRDLLTVANLALRERGLRGLVVICDGTEKVPRRHLSDLGITTHERLFVNRALQLADLGAHAVYSLPISLVYDPAFAQTVHAFGECCPPIPMVRLRPDDHGAVTPDTPGMKTMWRMVKARCLHAGLETMEVFDTPDTGHWLCEMSGGHPRHLITLLRSAANVVDCLPITREAAETAVRDYANGLLRGLPEDYWPLLRQFREPTEHLPKDEPHLQMLLWLYIFEYMNDNVWYEANPVLRTLDKFNRGD